MPIKSAALAATDPPEPRYAALLKLQSLLEIVPDLADHTVQQLAAKFQADLAALAVDPDLDISLMPQSPAVSTNWTIAHQPADNTLMWLEFMLQVQPQTQSAAELYAAELLFHMQSHALTGTNVEDMIVSRHLGDEMPELEQLVNRVFQDASATLTISFSPLELARKVPVRIILSASQRGLLDVLAWMIALHLNTNANQAIFVSAFWYAAYAGRVNVLDMLVRRVPNLMTFMSEPNRRSFYKLTAMGRPEVADWIIMNVPALSLANVTDDQRDQMFSGACSSDEPRMFFWMQAHNITRHLASFDNAGSISGVIAQAAVRNAKRILLWITNQFSVTMREDNDVALRYAAAGGHVDLVQRLVTEDGANVHALNDQPLRKAISAGKTEAAIWLAVESGAYATPGAVFQILYTAIITPVAMDTIREVMHAVATRAVDAWINPIMPQLTSSQAPKSAARPFPATGQAPDPRLAALAFMQTYLQVVPDLRALSVSEIRETFDKYGGYDENAFPETPNGMSNLQMIAATPANNTLAWLASLLVEYIRRSEDEEDVEEHPSFQVPFLVLANATKWIKKMHARTFSADDIEYMIVSKTERDRMREIEQLVDKIFAEPGPVVITRPLKPKTARAIIAAANKFGLVHVASAFSGMFAQPSRGPGCLSTARNDNIFIDGDVFDDDVDKEIGIYDNDEFAGVGGAVFVDWDQEDKLIAGAASGDMDVVAALSSAVDVRAVFHAFFAAMYTANFSAAVWLLSELPRRERQRAVDLLLIDASFNGAGGVVVWLVNEQHASLVGPSYDKDERDAIVVELGHDQVTDDLYRRISHGPLVAAVSGGHGHVAKWLAQKMMASSPPNYVRAHGDAALWAAVAKDNWALASWLLWESGAYDDDLAADMENRIVSSRIQALDRALDAHEYDEAEKNLEEPWFHEK